MKNDSALLAGTFDPPTLGHIDIIERAAKLFKHLYVGIAINSKKTNSTFSIVERQAMLSELCHALPNVKIVTVEGLAVEYAKENRIDFLIRALRSVSDYDSELQLAISNKTIGHIETVFLLANPQHAHISSTLIHEIARGGLCLHHFVPEAIEDAVFTRITMKM